MTTRPASRRSVEMLVAILAPQRCTSSSCPSFGSGSIRMCWFSKGRKCKHAAAAHPPHSCCTRLSPDFSFDRLPGRWPPANTQFFLHIFHHTTTATVGWFAWRQELTVAWLGPLSNSFVHVLMYGYYALVTVFPAMRKFGLYITPIQIVQFMLCLLSIVPESIDAIAFGGAHCGATVRCVHVMLFAYLTYLYLFVKMYRDKKAAVKAAKAAKAAKTK
jgi:hypothetical protein